MVKGMSDPDVNEQTTAATPQEVVRLRNQEYLTGYEEGNDDIAARIDAAIADDDMYEPGEPRPSLDAAARAKDLINSAGDAVRGVPCPEVSVYFGEIDVTWRVRNRLLRMAVFCDSARPVVLYFQTDNGEALTRGESVDVTGADDLSQKLVWLLG
jgi:hypothetical protein